MRRFSASVRRIAHPADDANAMLDKFNKNVDYVDIK